MIRVSLIGLATIAFVALIWSGAVHTWVVVLLALAVARLFGHH